MNTLIRPTKGLFLVLFSIVVRAQFCGAQVDLVLQRDGIAVRETATGRRLLSLPLEEIVPGDGGHRFLEACKIDPEVRFSRGSFFFENKKKICGQRLVMHAGQGDTLRGNLDGAPLHVVASLTDSVLRLEVAFYGTAKPYNSFKIKFRTFPGERFLGLGEQASFVEVSGKKVPVWVEEQGIGRGDKPITGITKKFKAAGDAFTSLAPMPVLSSTAGGLFFVHGTGRMVFDFTEPGYFSIECWQNSFKMDIFLHSSPLERLAAFTKRNGRPAPLPAWTSGNILGLQGGPDAVRSKIAVLEAAGTRVDAVWIQDWVGRRRTPFGSQLWWYWQADTAQYPDLPNFIRELNGRGIEVLGYVNPFLVEHGPLFEEARAKGFFVKKWDGSDYAIKATGFDAYLIDFTNPAAAKWMVQRIKTELIGAGFSGWMADFGEWLPWDAKLFDGRTGALYHNQYPVDWARINHEAVAEANAEGRVAFFMRSGYTGAAQFTPFYWAGDQNVNWGRHDGIGSVVPSLLSSGLSGMAVNHSDVGGFTAIKRFPVKLRRTRELLMRWIELGALSPVFRTHECLRPDENVQVYEDAEMSVFYARMAELRDSIRPYLVQCFAEASEKGWPVARHLWLHYPDDAECVGLQTQFLLGAEILVAPVLAPKENAVKVYFPGGKWRHLITGQEILDKGWQKISAPLGIPAVFRAF